MRDDESADDAGQEENDVDGVLLGSFLALARGKHECHARDEYAFCQFARLKGDIREGNVEPSYAVIDLCAIDERPKQHDDDGNEADDGNNLKPSAGNVMDEPCDERGSDEETCLLEEGEAKAAILVRQRGARTIDFNQTDDAEQEENNPDDEVALKDISFHCISVLG